MNSIKTALDNTQIVFLRNTRALRVFCRKCGKGLLVWPDRNLEELNRVRCLKKINENNCNDNVSYSIEDNCLITHNAISVKETYKRKLKISLDAINTR